MARINLLPWREERRKQRQREFYGMLGFAALSGVLLSGLLWFYFSQQISGQNERNAYLETEIAKVKEQNKEIDRLDEQKKRLLDRKAVIEELQGKRSQMVHLFDSLVRTIPDGVVLTALKQEGETLTLEGRTQSNARVSAYMRNLETSGWMRNPELTIIEARAQDSQHKGGAVVDIKSLPYVFTLKVQLPAPSDGQAEADGALTAADAASVAPAAGATPGAPAAAAPAAPAAPASGAEKPKGETAPAAPAQKEARS
ncbi:MAG: fimbrial protein [Stenotrophomonas sp.]|jgi:type IV pilus assembly protein PilN|nr:MAG: fimbrial protein [Stenotrophomonas sp.]